MSSAPKVSVGNGVVRAAGRLRESYGGTAPEHRENKYCHLKSDLQSVKKLFFKSWINILLIFIPIGIISHVTNGNPIITFFTNFAAMIPLANILGDSTECLAEHLGETVGGLLNATFGNAVEMVVMILALLRAKNSTDSEKETLLTVVQTSLIGSIFSNSLLVLGCSFLANGLIYKECEFNVDAALANVELLLLAAFVLILPGPYSEHIGTGSEDSLMVSRAAALILLALYICLLVFVLYTHANTMGSSDKSGTISINRSTIPVPIPIPRLSETESYKKNSSNLSSYNPLLDDPDFQSPDYSHLKLPSNTPRNDSNNSASSNSQGSNSSDVFNMPAITTQNSLINAEKFNLASASTDVRDGSYSYDEELELSLIASIVVLVCATCTVGVISEYLVDSINPMANDLNISPAFIGIILLPFIGNAVEHITAIKMAMQNKMDIAISIAIGSATQVAMFVVSMAVLIAWMLGLELDLAFNPFEINLFLYSTIIIFTLISDGKSNWLEGAMLLGLYILIGIAVWPQDYSSA